LILWNHNNNTEDDVVTNKKASKRGVEKTPRRQSSRKIACDFLLKYTIGDYFI
jgi:hypothetical protein